MNSVEKRIFRFGVFEADAGRGELRRAGAKLRLQGQPFQVLILLLERAGDVVTRDELRQKLWAADTFVDFDHSLNTIINKIREVLNDSATNPRFVETLAKRGYRLLVPVALITENRADLPLPSPIPVARPQEGSYQSTFLLTQMEELPAASGWQVRGLFLLIQIMYLVFYVVALARLPAVQDLLERIFGGHAFAMAIFVFSASIGIPVRLYLFTAASFDIADLSQKFLRLFPAVLLLDELWALSPFLLEPKIGIGLALGMTAALAYVPFAQRALVLMQARNKREQAKT